MRRLLISPSKRTYGTIAALSALALGGGIAQAALTDSDPKPRPKPLDRAVYDALRAPDVEGISARVELTNDLLPGGSLPDGAASPLATGAEGRLWLTADGRFRIELQAEGGDAQIVSDGRRFSVHDTSTNTVYSGALPQPEGDHPRADEERAPTLERVRAGLQGLAESWTMSGAKPTSTAQRPSYTVRISPQDDGGLLGAAELAWDAQRGVPLRVGVYSDGRDEPVLELVATEVSYDEISASRVRIERPAGARMVDLDPVVRDSTGRPVEVSGVRAVAKRVDFELAAPRTLAGLPRKQVRLLRMGRSLGAYAVYGEGLGAIVVLQRRADSKQPSDERPAGLRLPEVNIDGATGHELATALGTGLLFERDGVAYTVIGSVPPVAAERAARELR